MDAGLFIGRMRKVIFFDSGKRSDHFTDGYPEWFADPQCPFGLGKQESRRADHRYRRYEYADGFRSSF